MNLRQVESAHYVLIAAARRYAGALKRMFLGVQRRQNSSDRKYPEYEEFFWCQGWEFNGCAGSTIYGTQRNGEQSYPRSFRPKSATEPLTSNQIIDVIFGVMFLTVARSLATTLTVSQRKSAYRAFPAAGAEY